MLCANLVGVVLWFWKRKFLISLPKELRTERERERERETERERQRERERERERDPTVGWTAAMGLAFGTAGFMIVAVSFRIPKSTKVCRRPVLLVPSHGIPSRL